MGRVEREMLVVIMVTLVAIAGLYVLTGGKMTGLAHASTKQPGVVILCEEGGVYRSLSQTEGFLASGGQCVLADRHGGRSTAASIVVYDNEHAAP